MVASNLETARASLLLEQRDLTGQMGQIDQALDALNGSGNGRAPATVANGGRVKRGSLTAAILARASEGPFRPNDEFAEVSSSKASVANAAHRMMKQGKLVKVRPGTYRTPA